MVVGGVNSNNRVKPNQVEVRLSRACDQSDHGALMWHPHDVMRAPSGGAPMTSWGIVRSGEAFGQFSKPD